MSLASPLVIGLIPLLIVLVWWMFRPMRAADGSFAHIRRLWADRRGLSASSGTRRRRVRGVLLGLGAGLALCALARPQWGEIHETTFEQSREVLIALDLSRSMLANDVSPNRLERAKLLIESLLDQLSGERVGLAVFAGTAFLQSPLSADYEVLRDLLGELDPSYLPQGGSNYSAMLRTALQAFGRQGDGDRFLVVLSDGEAHDEQWKSLLPTLSQKGIRVIALGVGTADGDLVPAADGGVTKDEKGAAVLSRLEPGTLGELAAASGGVYRDAAAWVDIAELVDATVEKGRAGKYVEQSNAGLSDRFEWFLAPALLLLLLSFWLELPVLPVPRRLRKPQPARVRWAAVAALLLFVAPAARGSTGVPGLAPGGPGTARPTAAAESGTAVLESVIEELSGKTTTLAAPDYERLATATIEVAEAPQSLRGPARLGVIDDALRGVGEGEKLDPQAANWPELRQKLEELKKEPEPEQKEQPQEQASEPQNDGGEEQDQKNEAGQQGAGAEPNQSGEQGEQNEPAGDQAGNDEVDQAKPAAEPQSEGSPQQHDGGEETAEPEPLEDAGLGQLAEPAERKAEDEESGSRLVGGSAAQQEPLDAKNLAMVEALDRMQRIEDGDSPSVLFERMNRAEGVPPPVKNGKDW